MDELFRDFIDFEDLTDLDLHVFPGFGRTDIYLKDKTLVIETELPGARKEDIQVRVEIPLKRVPKTEGVFEVKID